VPEVPRRALIAVAAALALAGLVGSASVGTPDDVAPDRYHGHSSAAGPVPTLFVPTTTTPKTTTTARALATTTKVARSVATTTTTVLATVRQPATLVPTTGCIWSSDVWPQLDGASPTLRVHLTAPAVPNSTMTVTLFPHDGTVAQAAQSARADGAGHGEMTFPITPDQFYRQVDLTGGLVSNGVAMDCAPKTYTATLTPPV
jgi:hypothetical protein